MLLERERAAFFGAVRSTSSDYGPGVLRCYVAPRLHVEESEGDVGTDSHDPCGNQTCVSSMAWRVASTMNSVVDFHATIMESCRRRPTIMERARSSPSSARARRSPRRGAASPRSWDQSGRPRQSSSFLRRRHARERIGAGCE